MPTSQIVHVNGWSLVTQDGSQEEPLIQDIELATKLGFDRPRNIRKLIERHRRTGLLNDSEVCSTVEQTSRTGGRPATEYLLTEAGALKVIAKSETATANTILGQVIGVYCAYRRGLLAPVAAPSSSMVISSPHVSAALARLPANVEAIEARIERLERVVEGHEIDLARHTRTLDPLQTFELRLAIEEMARVMRASFHVAEGIYRKHFGVRGYKFTLWAAYEKNIAEVRRWTEDARHRQMQRDVADVTDRLTKDDDTPTGNLN